MAASEAVTVPQVYRLAEIEVGTPATVGSTIRSIAVGLPTVTGRPQTGLEERLEATHWPTAKRALDSKWAGKEVIYPVIVPQALATGQVGELARVTELGAGELARVTELEAVELARVTGPAAGVRTASVAATFREVAAATGMPSAEAREDTTEQVLALRAAEALPASAVLVVAGPAVEAVAGGDNGRGPRKCGVSHRGARS